MDRPTSTVTPRLALSTSTQNVLLALLVAAVFINYVDRGNLSVSTTQLTHELHLSPDQLGLLLGAFFWTYSFSQLLAGWLINRFNVHLIFSIGFLVWSLATAFTGLVNTFVLIFILRLLLGLGESVAYPAFAKIIATSFPENRRGIANGLIDSGSKFGPAIGTFAGGLIVGQFGWRALFLILGFGALIWLPLWHWFAPRTDGTAAKPALDPSIGVQPTMLDLLRVRSVWGSFLGLFAINYAWYFMITWFPTYLIQARGFTQQQMSTIGSLPFVAIGITSMIGGFWSDRLISSGRTPTRVRKTFCVTGLLMTTILLPAAIAPSDQVSLGLFLFACAAFGFTTSNHWAVTQTLAGPAAAGKWTGLQNCVGNTAGIVAPWVTGKIVAVTGGFALAFAAVAVMVVLGAFAYAFIIQKIEPIDWEECVAKG